MSQDQIGVSDSVVLMPTVCPLDCPDTCSLSAMVDGDEIVGIRGSRANPFTAGAVCSKVMRSYPEFVHGPDRLRFPLKRVGSRGSHQYDRITWSEAIDLVYKGFSQAICQYGPQSVLPFNYGGSHGLLAHGSMDYRFFHHLGASTLYRGALCGGVRHTAYVSLYGEVAGMPPEQAEDSDLIVVWGNNVTVSNLHFARIIKQAKNKDATVIVVDPKRTKIAEQADIHLQIEPGTDVVLAFAVAAELERRNAIDHEFVSKWTVGWDAYMAEARRWSLDAAAAQCGLPLELIEKFVAAYVNAKCVAVSVGNGIERGRSGGSGLRAAMALQALSGNHGRRGAGVIAKLSLAAPINGDLLKRPDLIPSGTREFNIVDIAEKLLDENLDPPIKATMIYGHNPVCTQPDQQAIRKALSQEDLFIVGSDVIMTDSMAYADVILPAASHFEFSDIYGAYGQNYLQRAEPVIDCVGESLPNTEIFRRLASRFGFDDPIFQQSDDELIDMALDAQDKRMKGKRSADIAVGTAMEITAPNGDDLIMCDTVVPATPSGKIELYSEDLERRFNCGVPVFHNAENLRSFRLISPSSSKRTNSMFGGCAESDCLEMLEMHPQDAKERNLSNEDVVRVWNDLGEVELRLVITSAVRRGVLYSPKGTWLRSSPTGLTVNSLISSTVRADIERGACYNETFVDVRPA